MGFRIKSINLHELKIPFRFAFSHASKTRSEAHNLFVELISEDGTKGYGEILTREYLTGETLESCKESIKKWWDVLRELNFERATFPSESLTSLFIEADRQRKNGAFAGIDVAIHDLWARMFKISGKELIGDLAPSPAATAPVGIKMPIAVVGRFFKSMGFEEFKLKVGDDADEDRLLSLRKLTGDSVDLRVDANEHWNAEQALHKLTTFAKAGITSCEQPVPGRDYEAMGRVAKEGPIQIMADESICTLEDARTLIECGGAKIWNLRLAKIGGFTGMRHFIKLGDQHKIEYQLGVLVGESSLLSAASRACFGLTQFRHVEFGFPGILLGADPFKGISLPEKGRLKPLGETLSFGVEPTKYFEKFRLGTTKIGD